MTRRWYYILGVISFALALLGFLWHSMDWLKGLNAAAQGFPTLKSEHDGFKQNFTKVNNSLDVIMRKLDNIRTGQEPQAEKHYAAQELAGNWLVKFGNGNEGRLSMTPTDAEHIEFTGSEVVGKETQNAEGKGRIRGNLITLTYTVNVRGKSWWKGRAEFTIYDKNSLSGWFQNDKKEYDTLDLKRAP